MRHGRKETELWKQSADFVQCVEGFLVELEDRLVDFRDVEYRGFVKTAQEILTLFYFKFPETPLLSRMNEVAEYFIDEYETLYDKTIKEEDRELIRQKFQALYVTRDVYTIYNWLLKDAGRRMLPSLPREKRYLKYADVYPLLYLKYRLCSAGKRRTIRHLVIDEMQDYSYLQYTILEQMFSCNMTILGDKAQTIDEKEHDVLQFLPRIFGRKIRRIEINKSYRNTIEIARYAQKISGITGIDCLERHGREVEEASFASLSDAMEAVLAHVRLGVGKFETAAVLTMTEQEARDCYDYLAKRRENVSYIDRDSSKFRRGITVTTFYQAKGLEFDQVFLAGGDENNSFYGQYCYIGATRALHELYQYKI
jgi:DNA helicase-2/ATP-dependent DNA helicase PcrA